MSRFFDWLRGLLAAVIDVLQKILPNRCPIPWRPNALAPVFYGVGDVGPTDGAPATARVYFPSLDGSPESAAILMHCGRYPLIVFAHGHCVGDPDHYLKWIEIPAQLARAGYVVVVPQLPQIGGGTAPSQADDDLARLRDLVAWMRTGWVHRSTLEPSPGTGLVGHSFGAGLAGRLAAEGNLRAYASLSGHVASPVREAIEVPKLFTWGFPPATADEQLVPILDDAWARVGIPKHRIVFAELSHWDYVPPGRVPCEQGRGACRPAGVVAWDLVITFFGTYLPPPAVPDLPDRIPPSLIPPQLDLTEKQQFFAGGWLSGVGLLEDSSDNCAVTIAFETSTGNGTVGLP
jgi:dienelactone hydrolase